MAVATRFPTVFGAGWNTVANMGADDDLDATALPGKSSIITSRVGTFGFNGVIPTGATINTVKLIFEYFLSTTASIATFHSTPVVSGVGQTLREDASEPLVRTVITLDHTADRAWTRADLLDGTLEWDIGAHRAASNNGVTFNCDYVKCEVDYSTGQDQIGNATLPSTGILQSVGVLLLAATSALSGSGLVSASAIVNTTHEAAASLSSTASISAAALVNTTHAGLASLSSTASVSSTALVNTTHEAAASLSSTAAVLASGSIGGEEPGKTWYAGRTFLLSTMPSPTASAAGSMIFVSDAAAGAQFKGCDGSSWINL